MGGALTSGSHRPTTRMLACLPIGDHPTLGRSPRVHCRCPARSSRSRTTPPRAEQTCSSSHATPASRSCCCRRFACSARTAPCSAATSGSFAARSPSTRASCPSPSTTSPTSHRLSSVVVGATRPNSIWSRLCSTVARSRRAHALPLTAPSLTSPCSVVLARTPRGHRRPSKPHH